MLYWVPVVYKNVELKFKGLCVTVVTNLVASHHTTAVHHPWTTSPIIPIHHYTNHTAVTIHSLALIVSPHLHLIHTHTFKQHSYMHSPRSLVLPRLSFWAFPLYSVSLCLPALPIYSDRLLPAFLTLPAVWYPLCLLPAPSFALPLLLILPCLRDTCYCLWPLPVWPSLVVH